METAFAWVGQVVEWVGRFIPRILIVRSTHAGVRFKKGKNPVEIMPGICIYWPLVTEVEVIPVARQTHNLPSQCLTTKDGKKVVVGGIVVYAISDIVSAIAKNWDVSETINDITLCAMTHVVTKHDYQHILENLTGSIQDELTLETRKKLRVYGVKVYRTAVTDFATALVIKNVGSMGGTILAHNRD